MNSVVVMLSFRHPMLAVNFYEEPFVGLSTYLCWFIGVILDSGDSSKRFIA